MKKINQYDWNLRVDELTGNFISTIVMNDLTFEKKNGEGIRIDKISINLGIFSSLFGDIVFDTIIQRNIKLGEAPGFGKDIITYDVTSKGTKNYLSLADEIIKKNVNV